VADKLGKSLNDDDNSSFHSCFDDLHQLRGIFDEDDLDRFPPNTTFTSNHPGHGFLTVTKITELTCAVSVFIFAQWMAASISVMLSYLMAIEKRTAFQNLVGVDFVLLTNAPLLTCCVVLNVL
jgi:hypothetical protein